MADHRPHPLNARASQGVPVSLLQLDPMPMVDVSLPRPDTEKGLSSPHVEMDGMDSSTPGANTFNMTTSALGLSGAGHGAVYYLTRAQRYSSYTFTIFTSVHLVTTSLVPLAMRSVSASESYLLLSREIYQTRMSEPLLVIVPIVVHVAAGIGLRLVRRSQNLRRYGDATPALWPISSSNQAGESRIFQSERDRGQRARPWSRLLQSFWRRFRLYSGWPSISLISASGYAFLVALASHVVVNRLLPLAVEGDSADIGLAYVAHGFARRPVATWLLYGAFLGLASGHMIWGWARWLHIAQEASWGGTALGSRPNDRRPMRDAIADKATRQGKRRTWLAIQTATVVVFAAWASGGLGVVARGGRMQGWVGTVYDGLFEKVWL